jgi:hypothetical protein
MSFQSMGCHRTDITDPQPKSEPSFMIDGFTNGNEMHKMFSSKQNIECFENDAMFPQIHSLLRTKNETFR